MKQCLFSTENYDELTQHFQFEDEEYILQNFSDYTVIFTGEIKLWSGVHKFSRLGNFIDLYNETLEDCNEYEIFIEDSILNIYGIHHDGYIFVQVHFLNDQDEKSLYKVFL